MAASSAIKSTCTFPTRLYLFVLNNMKTLLLLFLFLIVVPLLIGHLAGLSSRSGSGLVQLATMAGLLILFTLYLVFIDKKPEEKQKKTPSSTSAQSDNYEFTCDADYPIYEKEHKVLPCEQPVECPHWSYDAQNQLASRSASMNGNSGYQQSPFIIFLLSQ